MNTTDESQTEATSAAKAATTAETTASVSKKKNFLLPAIFLLFASGLLVGGYFLWKHLSTIEETDDATIVGRVHQLSSRVSGTVVELLVHDNEHVKQDQLILEIDPKDYQLTVDTAKASQAEAELKRAEIESSITANERQAEAHTFEAQSAVASANANVDKAKAALSEIRLGVALAQTEIRQREAELTRAIADFDRYKMLVEDRAATKQSYDKAKQDKEVGEANLQAAHEALKQAQTRVHQATQAVADAEAEVTRAKGAARSAEASRARTERSRRTLAMQTATIDKAKTELESAVTKLSYTKIVAPVTGKVGHRTVEVGQQIERGQLLMSIVSDDKWVVANFKETQLTKIRPGQEVDIKVDAYPGVPFKGVVESISPASGAQFALLPPDNASGNFTKVVQRLPVKIVFKKESLGKYADLLAPGMSVIPVIHVSKE